MYVVEAGEGGEHRSIVVSPERLHLVVAYLRKNLGTVRVYRRPTGSTEFAEDYDDAVALYSGEEAASNLPAAFTLEHLLPHAKRVLEIGCGDGYFLGTLRKTYPTMEVFGVDVNEHSLRRVPEGIPVSLYDGRSLPFDDSSFDVVVSKSVIEHLPVPLLLDLQRECLRVAPNTLHSLDTADKDPTFFSRDATHRVGLRREGWLELLRMVSPTRAWSEKWHPESVVSFVSGRA